MKQVKIIYDALRSIKRRYFLHDYLRIWYDPEKDTIIKEMPDNGLYDLYVLKKNGKIKRIKLISKLKVIAKRFRLYKRYLVIVQMNSENDEIKEEVEEEIESKEA